MRRKKTENQKLIRRESKVRHDLTFINPDAKRDGEDSVWRLLGPGTDSELIRPRCALRRDAACGLETRASIDVALQARRTSMKLMKLKIFNEEKSKTKSCSSPPNREGADFCSSSCCFVAVHDKTGKSPTCKMHWSRAHVQAQPSSYSRLPSGKP